MAYTKHTWLPRLGTGLNKFSNSGSAEHLVLTPEPDTVTQEGTPFSAAWLNEMEDGIYRAHSDLSSHNSSESAHQDIRDAIKTTQSSYTYTVTDGVIRTVSMWDKHEWVITAVAESTLTYDSGTEFTPPQSGHCHGKIIIPNTANKYIVFFGNPEPHMGGTVSFVKGSLTKLKTAGVYEFDVLDGVWVVVKIEDQEVTY